MSEPFVVSTVCVRRRPWAAAGWVAAMAAQGRRPDAALVVVDGWSDDESSAATTFNAWALGDKPARDTRVERYPHPSAIGWHRGTRESGWKEVPEGVAGRYSDDQHAHLARLRNWTVERALELWPAASHIWCCDSDVQPEPDVLELLLAADKPVVGAVVRNSERAWNFMLDWSSGEPQRQGTEWEYLDRDDGDLHHAWRPFPVTMTGACALYQADLFRGQGLGSIDRRDGFGAAAGLLRWGPHPRGEDIALAIQARELGIGLWVEPRARCAHFMNGPDQEPLR